MNTNLESVLRRLEPDLDGLLTWLRSIVCDEDLQAVANADGAFKSDENLEALRLIARSGNVPFPLTWELREVCELERWSDPVELSRAECVIKPGKYPKNHRCRALACTILLYSAADDREGYSKFEGQTAGVLLASSIVLGNPAVALTRKMFAEIVLRGAIDPEEQLHLAFGALLALVWESQQKHSEADPDTIRDLANAIITEETRVRNAVHGQDSPTSDCPWLWGLTSFRHREQLWRSLVRHILLGPLRDLPQAVVDQCRFMGKLATAGQP